jgi:Protein of unknown function (DUF3592)
MKADRKARLLGLFGLGVVTVFLSASIGSDLYYSFVSRRWPKAVARIRSSAVITGTSNAGRWWAPDVEYEYEVGGKLYRSSTIRYPSPTFYKEELAAEVLTPYSPDRQLDVAYNPADPGRSVLEAGVSPAMLRQALIPLFFWVLSLYIFYEINHPHRRILLRSNPE